MEPTFEQAPGSGDLPRPAVSETVGATYPPEGKAAVAETAPSADGLSTVPVAAQAQPTQVAGQDNGMSATVTPPAVATDNALIADDADLIEKEWVARAKAVVEQTKTDPFIQNRELTKVKADYIKKRYNKDIKVSE